MDIVVFITIIGVIISLFFYIRNDKGYIYSRIEKKERRIQSLQNRLVQKYGLYGKPFGAITKEEIEIQRLNADIQRLRRRL